MKLFGCPVVVREGFQDILLYNRPPIRNLRIEESGGSMFLVADVLQSDIDKSLRGSVLIKNIGKGESDMK